MYGHGRKTSRSDGDNSTKNIMQVYCKSKNEKKVLYVKHQKTLFGLLKSSLIIYKTLLKDLLSMGFRPNPYDPCVVNEIIDGSQMMITWLVMTLKHCG